jgi:hypothetical protein
MTQEGQGTSPEQKPSPPARTRWTGTDPVEDTGLLAPFVPGRSRGAQPEPERPSADRDIEPDADPAVDAPLEPWGEEAPADPWAEAAFEDLWGEATELGLGEPGAPAQVESTGEEWSPDLVPLDDTAGPEADLADRLAALAQRLRTEGRSGLEAETRSDDRITAVIAAFLTGYLAAREE